jgi:DNA-binding transcriptional regulator LsrR (DeoR family)
MTDSQHRVLSQNLFHRQPELEESQVKFELLARVATLYYLEDKTQAEIAKEIGLSRQKVQRLLKQAREQRVVEIHIHAIPMSHFQIENKLKEVFNLRDAIIAPSHPSERQRRLSVAQAAAAYLDRNLKDGQKVAFGLGRNASEVANTFRPTRALNCLFVSAMGGSARMGDEINPNEICTRIAARSGGKAQQLYAPAYVESKQVRKLFMEQEAVRETITLAREADIAVMGIGTANDDSILVQAGCQTIDQMKNLRKIGAVGEIVGNYFDMNGKKVPSDLDERVISLSLQELKDIPLVIAVASEFDKDVAILGALRTGAIHTLVTECQLALTVLQYAGVSDMDVECSYLGYAD